MTYDDLKKLCAARHSIRYFDQEKTVTLDDILPLLELAQLAPNVENTQPWHFHIVINEQTKKDLMDHSCYGNFVAGASAFVVVTCDTKAQLRAPDVLWQPKDLEYSCAAAMENILLGATARGLAGCWVTLQPGPIREILNIRIDHKIVGGLMLGHLSAGEKAENTRKRVPLEKIYTVHE